MLKTRKRIILLAFLLGLSVMAIAQYRRIQIMERWNDPNWSRVIVKLKSGEEIAYDRSQLWGLFYEYGTGSATSPPPASGTAISPLPASSRWTLIANRTHGTLTLHSTSSGWTGQIYLDGIWEPLADISVNPTTGAIAFRREGAGSVTNQRFVGVIRGNSMTGTFGEHGGTSGYNWSATRE